MTSSAEPVTLLFTDIEGSVRLWEEAPGPMRDALARHDVLLRDAVARHGGRVFNTAGDAFRAVFAHAPDALGAALDAQRALLAEAWPADIPLRVRMALATGTVETHERDFVGPTVNRAAQILAVGHGGQILLSRATRERCRHTPGKVGFQLLGEHRLPEVTRRVGVFQLTHPDLPSTFPPLNSLDDPDLPNNLPLQITAFIGREAEIARGRDLLRTHRLLTLTGSGGCGKTRLALRIAADDLERHPDGVWFVDLAPLTDPARVAEAVAQAAGVTVPVGLPAADALARRWRERRLLVVLDNCEHLRDACAHLCETLLRACPDVALLATSRQALGAPGEHAHRVPSLVQPDPGPDTPWEEIARNEAVRLLVDRARLVRPDFAVTERNARLLARICTRLDGIPLAIELAASRLRSLSPTDLDARLDERFRLLRGGSRAAMPRQQTLRALVDWSVDLLHPAERTLLERLSVFSGGWTRDAAQAVCADDALPAETVPGLLASLVDQSLVAVEERDGVARHRFLETVRQYAREMLEARGDADALRRRHRDHFLAWAETIGPARHLPPNVARLEPEHDNLRAALEFCVRADDGAEPGLRLLCCLLGFWDVCGYAAEAEDRVDRMLRHPGIAASSAWLDVCGARILLDEVRGTASLEQVRERLEALLPRYRALDDRIGEMMTFHTLAEVCLNAGDVAAGERCVREALALCRAVDAPRALPALTALRGHVAFHRGDHAAALERFREAHALDEAAGQRAGTAHLWVGYALLALGDVGEAEAVFRECVERFAVGARSWLPHAFDGLARVACARGDVVRAARLLGAAERQGGEVRSTVFVQLLPFLDPIGPALVAALGADAFDAAYASGRALSADRACAVALEEDFAAR